jgi:hypothetical protein
MLIIYKEIKLCVSKVLATVNFQNAAVGICMVQNNSSIQVAAIQFTPVIKEQIGYPKNLK